MSTHDTFLKAILAEPDDTGLRLVYADWLEEHGDPERAEFIRLECQRDSYPNSDPRWEELRDRAAALEQPNAKRWFGAVAPLVEGYSTRRGFVEGIELTAGKFVKHAKAIFALAPVRDV